MAGKPTTKPTAQKRRPGRKQPKAIGHTAATRSATVAKGWATRRARAAEDAAAARIIADRNARVLVRPAILAKVETSAGVTDKPGDGAAVRLAPGPTPEQRRTMARDEGFRFVLGQDVLLNPESPEHALVKVVGRSDNATGCEYRVEFDQGDGRKATRWYPEDRLMALYPAIGCGRL